MVPHLALGSLVKTTSDLQPMAVSFRLGWTPVFSPGSFLSAQGPMVYLMSGGHCQYHLHLPLEGASGDIGRVESLGHPLEHCSVFRKSVGVMYSF